MARFVLSFLAFVFTYAFLANMIQFVDISMSSILIYGIGFFVGMSAGWMIDEVLEKRR
jgi:hypothetical protein